MKTLINKKNNDKKIGNYTTFITGTINQIVSKTNRGQNIEQNTVVEKREVVELVDEYLEREK